MVAESDAEIVFASCLSDVILLAITWLNLVIVVLLVEQTSNSTISMPTSPTSDESSGKHHSVKQP